MAVIYIGAGKSCHLEQIATAKESSATGESAQRKLLHFLASTNFNVYNFVYLNLSVYLSNDTDPTLRSRMGN